MSGTPCIPLGQRAVVASVAEKGPERARVAVVCCYYYYYYYYFVKDSLLIGCYYWNYY